MVLVVQILNEHKRRGLVHELKQRVDDIPKYLGRLFAEILQAGPSEVPYTSSMLQLIAFAHQPLTREEVYHSFLYSESQHETASLIDATQDDMEQFMMNYSKGLAAMTIGMCPTVQLIHESVRNHLLYTGLKTDVPALCENLPAWCHDATKILRISALDMCSIAQWYFYSSQLMDKRNIFPITSGMSPHSIVRPVLCTLSSIMPWEGVITHTQQAHCAGRPQRSFIMMFPLDSWIRLHNMLVASHNLRLSRDARLVYILVIKGAFQLVKLIIKDASWRPDTGNLTSEEQHRTLLGTAADRGDYQTLEILLKMGVSPTSDARDEQNCL